MKSLFTDVVASVLPNLVYDLISKWPELKKKHHKVSKRKNRTIRKAKKSQK